MTSGSASPLLPIQSPLVAQNSAIVQHGFFTRQGGVSEGLYKGLNVGLGSRDAPECIHENRARVARWFGKDVEDLATLYQIHSAEVVVVNEANKAERPQADGCVTNQPGIVLGVLTADCGPILFADRQNRVIGAAHAGWKGAFSGVLEATVDAMIALGAKRETIVASLGPSISAENYEVGPEFVARFVTDVPSSAGYFTPSKRPDHSMFDLPGYTIDRLRAAGVQAENLNICTYADSDLFYSYRRTTHAKEPDYGRQISAIMIRE